MTARLMDLIVRYHELPKGEIVTKRDEIARELPSYWALSKQRVWDMLIDAHACLAERDQLLHEIDKWCSGENQVDDGEDAEDALRYIQDAIRAALAGVAIAPSYIAAERSREIERIVGDMERRFCTVCTANEGSPHNKGCSVGELRKLLAAPRKEPRNETTKY